MSVFFPLVVLYLAGGLLFPLPAATLLPRCAGWIQGSTRGL